MPTESIAAQVYSFIIGLSGFQAYSMILAVLFACGLGLPVPEDITLFAAGFLAFKERITLTGAVLVGIIGVLVGDSFIYWIGRIFGRKVFQWPVFRRMFSETRIKRAEEKIQKNARIICFTTRFVPGLRAPVYITSGTMGVPFHVFFVMDALAASISVPLWVSLAYYLGDKIENLLEIAKTAKFGVGIVIGVLLLGYILFKLRKRFPGKRLLNT